MERSLVPKEEKLKERKKEKGEREKTKQNNVNVFSCLALQSNFLQRRPIDKLSAVNDCCFLFYFVTTTVKLAACDPQLSRYKQP